MIRILSAIVALVLALFAAAPAVLAAEPWDGDEHVVFSTGGDFDLAAGQHADLLVIVSGDAKIAGDAGAVVVIDGTATFTNAHTASILAIRSRVSLDAASAVIGDVHVIDSVIDATPSAITGSIKDVGSQLAGTWVFGDVARAVLYLGFVVTGLFAALVMAALASRQVREAGRFIQHEPVATVVAAFAGLLGIALAGAVAIITVIGAPLGLAVLVVALPFLLISGYLTAGIWVGDLIVSRMSPTVTRERPYLAAVVGVTVVAIVSVIPILGGLISLAGFGAVVLYLWRTFRAGRPATTSVQPAPAASAS
jgi:hypothetical protein